MSLFFSFFFFFGVSKFYVHFSFYFFFGVSILFIFSLGFQNFIFIFVLKVHLFISLVGGRRFFAKLKNLFFLFFIDSDVFEFWWGGGPDFVYFSFFNFRVGTYNLPPGSSDSASPQRGAKPRVWT